MNKDIDLQKIDVLNDYVQAKFNMRGNYVIGAFIGMLIFLAESFFHEIIDFFLFMIFTTVLVLLFACLIWFVNKPYNDFLMFVDGLHKKMEKEETLPSIMELKKRLRKKPKPT